MARYPEIFFDILPNRLSLYLLAHEGLPCVETSTASRVGQEAQRGTLGHFPGKDLEKNASGRGC